MLTYHVSEVLADDCINSSMLGVCEAICVRGDAVQSQDRRGGTSQTLSSGDGLTRKPISNCVVEWLDCGRGVWGPSSLS